MKIYREFHIEENKRELICFVGAGGKTTTMFNMAKELRALGKKVLVTTTTAIYYPDESLCDKIILSKEELNTNLTQKKNSIIVMGKEVSKEGKLRGFSEDFINEIYNEGTFDYLLVEGDGAKRKAIKAPADYEPVVPKCTTKTIAVIGMDVLGKSIGEDTIHRSKQFCKITDGHEGHPLDERLVSNLIISKLGLFKGIPIKSEKYLLLNKVKDIKAQKSALKIIDILLDYDVNIDRVIVGDVLSKSFIGNWTIKS